METIVVVAAEPWELRGLAGRLDSLQPVALPLRFARRGMAGDRELWLLANGPGPLARGAVAWLLARCRPGLLISTGACGACNPGYRIGDIFLPRHVRSLPDGSNLPLQALPCRLPHRCGTLGSVDRVIGQAGEKAALFAQGVDAVDMETGALAQLARSEGIPLACLRVVSDEASESFSCDFNAIRGPDGRFIYARLLPHALRRPAHRIPELLRLARRTRLITERIADALAESVL